MQSVKNVQTALGCSSALPSLAASLILYFLYLLLSIHTVKKSDAFDLAESQLKKSQISSPHYHL